ncbi:MAG: TonB-dependent receptor [Cyclobacteriaceae bacterium]|nr:TonB-dependent receptor [Cyclobacteriaceae bacterium]
MTKFYRTVSKYLAVLLVFASLGLQAQERTVTGKVTSSDDGSPIPGVNILEKGTQNGTVSDSDGNFIISLSKEATLVFSFVGFKTKDVVVTTQSSVSVQLESDIQALSEVVVVGYGTQQKAEITGSISSVKGGEIQNISVSSFDAALQGRVAGAQITQSSGIPGSAVRLRIRGQSSVSGNSEPLYVVDGVPITSGDFSKRDGSANGINGNVLADINPNDIESMEVLKDAAAAAIYGSRAANGVVLITTKRGKSGKTVFNAGYYAGTNEVTRKLNFINSTEWLALMDEASRNSSGFPISPNYNLGRGLTPSTAVAGGANTNWRDQILRTGSVQEASVSASGGSEKTRFYVGGTYRKDESYFIGNSFERVNARINVDHNATDKLTIGTQTAISSTTNNQVPNVWGTAQSSALPIFPIRNQDGTYFGNTLAQGQNTGANPVAQLENKFKTDGFRLFNNVYLNYKITNDLVFRTEFGLDVLNQFDEIYTSYHNRFLFPLDYSPVSTGGQPIALPRVNAGGFEERRLNVVNWNSNNILTYSKTFGNHKVEALVGFAAQKSSQRTTGAYTNGNAGFRDNYFTNTVDGLQIFDRNLVNNYPVMGGYNADVDNVYSFISYFSRINYVNNGKYLASVSVRSDGSSRFGSNNKFGFFPAVSAGWILTKEDFIKSISWISFLKAKASFGITGNAEIGNFGYLATYGGSGGYLGQSGLAAQRIANPDLRWEKNNQFDVGFEFGLFDEKITGSIGYYSKISKDLLFVEPIQSSTGFTGVLKNTGIEIQNSGIELNLTSRNITSGNFSWTTDLNISSNQNEVLSTGGLPIEAFASGLGESRLIAGYPVGQGFMMKSAGVDPADGREQFFDNEGNKLKLTIENTDYRKPVGKPFPDFFGGINNSVKYKGIELNFLFTFQSGNTIFDNEAKFQIGDIANNNQRREVLNRWQSPETPGDGKTPGLFLSGAGSGRALNSDRFMYDASFLRLRTVTLSYTLPQSIVSKARLNMVRFFVSGQNLLLFTKFPGWDPEFVNTSNVGNTGQFFSPFGSSGQVSQFQQANITFNAAQNPFPQTRTFTAGVNISF